MNILIYGAGVLGSRYAASLTQTGNQVTLLARGKRAEQLREYGIVLQEAESGKQNITPVNICEELKPDDEYDLVIILMRANQAEEILPVLAKNKNIPAFLFLGNNAGGFEKHIKALGKQRVLSGFAFAAGTRKEHVIYYLDSKEETQGRTLIGELEPQITPRLKEIQEAFSTSEFPVIFETRVDAWLKTHAVLILPLAYGVYMAGGDNYRLANTPDILTLILRAIREGFKVIKAMNIPITPAKYKALTYIPEPLLYAILKGMLGSKGAEIGVAGHANAAHDEMNFLSDQLVGLIRQSGVSTPSLDCLLTYRNPAQPPMRENSKQIPLKWGGLLLILGTLTTGLLAVFKLVKKLLRK